MAVEIFSKAQFEAALPRNKVTGAVVWVSGGFVDGEYVYVIPVSDHVEIIVRSSIKEDGFSAGTGEDSIRLWLADPVTNRPLSAKITRWIARTGAWRDRLVGQLRTLYKLGKQIGPCPKCSATLALFKVKKEGPNKGKLFFKCDCGHFAWVAE